MTNNGNMEKSRSHGLIYLTFPFLTSYITAALNQFIQSIISKNEYLKKIQMSFMMTYLQSKYQYTLIITIKFIQILLF